MSKTKKEKINVISIPEDKTATLVVGGLFYQRLNKLLMDHGDGVDKNKLIHSMSMIQHQRVKPTDSYTFNLETLIILLRDVEKAFQEAGHTVDNEIEVDVPEDYKEINDLAKKFTEGSSES